MEDPRRLHPVTFFKDGDTDPAIKDFRPKRVDPDASEDAAGNPINADEGFPITPPANSQNRRLPKD